MKVNFRPFVLISVCLLLAASSRSAIAAPAQSSFLGTVEFEASDLEVLEQWQDVLERVEAEGVVYQRCDSKLADCGPSTLLAWRALIGRLHDKPLRQQVEEIDQFANTRTALTDEEVFGTDDHWATPLEFLEKSGDSEDFAIMKYVSLRQIGLPAEQMRLLLVHDTLINQSEFVLVVFDGDKPLFLGAHWGFVAEQQHMPYHIPYYSMNEDRRWTHYRALQGGNEE